MSKWIVGLSTYKQNVKWARWNQTASILGYDYIDLAVAAGLSAVLLPPIVNDPRGFEELDRIASELTADGMDEFQSQFELILKSTESYAEPIINVLGGLILVGGEDVCPLIYGQLPGKSTGDRHLLRDIFEIALIRVALAHDLPILAICRGHQILNVACGGTLIQDIHETFDIPSHNSIDANGIATEVLVDKGSIVSRIYSPNEKVTCYHHQSLGKVASILKVTATSRDGVIEAVEAPDYRYVLGLQWHPEKADDLRPFLDFAKAVMS
jgi:anthranilate synthase component 2/putative glutamine amidotransferase